MKKVLFLMLFLSLWGTVCLNAQVTIGDNKEPEKFSALEIISNGSNALRLPQLTAAQRDELAVSGKELAKGLIIYNTDTDCIEYWNGSTWISQCAPTSIKVEGGSILAPGGHLDAGEQPGEIINIIPPTGGTAPYTYEWQYCLGSCNVAANWKPATDLCPAIDNTKASYTPCPLNNTTWFRRQVTDDNGNDTVSNSVKYVVNLVAGTLTDPAPIQSGQTTSVAGSNSSGGLAITHLHQWEYCLDGCNDQSNWYWVSDASGGYNCSEPGTDLSYTTCQLTKNILLRRRDMDTEQAHVTNTVLVTVNTSNPKGSAQAISINATTANVCQDSETTIQVSFDPAHLPSPTVTNPVWIVYAQNGAEVGNSGTAYISPYTFTVHPATAPQTKYYVAFKGTNYDENLQDDRKEVVVNVTAKVTPSVSISSDKVNNTINQGETITFTATPSTLGGGTVSNYNWKVNGNTVLSGPANTYQTNTLAQGNTVECEITILSGCLTGDHTSSSVIVTVRYPVDNSQQGCANFLRTTTQYATTGWRNGAYNPGLGYCLLKSIAGNGHQNTYRWVWRSGQFNYDSYTEYSNIISCGNGTVTCFSL